MLKAITAVIVGFIVWTLLFLGCNAMLLALFPESFNADGSANSFAILLLVLWLSMVFSMVSGVVCSLIGKNLPFKSCLSLGVLLLIIGITVQWQYWDIMPLWYHFIFLLALIPGVLTGHWITSGRKGL